ncbi:MAG: helix-turn-helix domain-containing protein [Planctomycetota bacterium]
MCCSSEQLKSLRKARGLTQAVLASTAGYSERLIRKLESGQAVHPDTVEIVAEALSEKGPRVHPEDLLTSPRQVAQAWVDAYRELEGRLVEQYRVMLDETVECFVAGDPEEIPIAGTWYGIDGFSDLWQAFFSAFDRPCKETYQPTIMVEGQTAISQGFEKIRIRGTDILGSSWVVMKFEVVRGKAVRISDLFDTSATEVAIAEGRGTKTA